jgi:hypothetical protein
MQLLKCSLFLSLILALVEANVLYTFVGDRFNSKVTAVTENPTDELWVAQATYSPASDHVSNFAQLSIKTNAKFGDTVQTFAAGYLEGYLTAESIHQHYANMMCQVDCSGYVSPELKSFFETQDVWTRQQIEEHPTCPYWGYVGER